MSYKRIRGHLFLGLSFLTLLSSCASPISTYYREEAAPGLTFPMVFRDPAAYKGSIVIWGGTIMKTVIHEKGTELFVLESPLGTREKPKSRDYARGRFIATSASYLDPFIYQRGRKVTLAGKVVGEKTIAGRRSKVPYRYPVVEIKELHLWARESYSYPPYYYGPPYYGPYYDWYGWDYPFFEGDEFNEEEHEGMERHEFEREHGERR